MPTDLLSCQLTASQFTHITDFLYRFCGINMGEGKEDLVKGRLLKRLRLLHLDSFDAYLDYVEADKSGSEISIMVDTLTTNKTDFFREPAHFEYLTRHILPAAQSARHLRIWSAGCSSGEEPYTIAITLREEIADLDRWDVRILATDISGTILARAKNGVYTEDQMDGVPARLVPKYFTLESPASPHTYRVTTALGSLIQFARLNLMGDWPMKGPFDLIFCRNVMIYFDKPTQNRLVHRYWELLKPGGHLFVGHSESLTTSSREFQYVKPAIYAK